MATAGSEMAPASTATEAQPQKGTLEYLIRAHRVPMDDIRQLPGAGAMLGLITKMQGTDCCCTEHVSLALGFTCPPSKCVDEPTAALSCSGQSLLRTHHVRRQGLRPAAISLSESASRIMSWRSLGRVFEVRLRERMLRRKNVPTPVAQPWLLCSRPLRFCETCLGYPPRPAASPLYVCLWNSQRNM